MVDVEECNTLGEILDSAVDEFTESDRKEALKTESKELKKKRKAGIFFFTWWALKSEEDFQYLNDNSAYPRDLGKGSRVEYEEPGRKDRTIILQNDKPTGKVTGKFLGINGISPLDTPFKRQAPGGFGVDFNEWPFIALGAAVAQPKDRDVSTEKFRVINPESLRWKWDLKKVDDLKPDGDGWIKGRVVDIEKVEKALGIDIDYDTEPLSLTPEQVTEILDESNDVGVPDADVPTTIGTLAVTPKTDDKGYFYYKHIELGKNIICRARKNGYIENKIGHINPERPLNLTKDRNTEEKIIVPLVRKEVEGRDPEIIIRPIPKFNKHGEPLKPEWDSPVKPHFIGGAHLIGTAGKGNEDMELAFESRKKASKNCKGFFYLFLAEKLPDGRWARIAPWPENTIHLNKVSTWTHDAGQLEQFIPRMDSEGKEGWTIKGWDKIFAEFNIPKEVGGEFRLYALVTKGNKIPTYDNIFDYPTKGSKDVDNKLYDFNYRTFTVGEGKKNLTPAGLQKGSAAPSRGYPAWKGKFIPGLIEKPIPPGVPEYKPTVDLPTDPFTIDLSPGFLGIKCQDSLGACVAFATVSVVEYIHNQIAGWSDNNMLSELYLYYVARLAQGKNADEDSGLYNFETSFQVQREGVCRAELWPFPSTDAECQKKFKEAPTPDTYSDAPNHRILRIELLSSHNTDEWIKSLIEGNPVIIGVNVPDEFHGHKGGLIDKATNPGGGHAMVVVGYDSTYISKDGKSEAAFKIRNSWGADWGGKGDYEQGYAWVSVECLKRIMKDVPLVITGWNKSKIENIEPIEINGRVVDNNPAYKDLTGRDIYNQPTVLWVNDHDVDVGIIYKQGDAVKAEEQRIRLDAAGKFKFISKELNSANIKSLQPITTKDLDRNKKDFFKDFTVKEIKAEDTKYPCIIIYKWITDEKGKKLFKAYHMVNKMVSEAGRGGLGAHLIPGNDDNPKAEGPYSGIPIIFRNESQEIKDLGLKIKHLKEEYVIIPVVDTVHIMTKDEEEKVEKELTDTLMDWQKKHQIIGANKEMGLKWHYEKDDKTARKIKEDLVATIEAGQREGLLVSQPNVLIINKTDYSNNYRLINEYLDSAIKAWSKNSPGKAEELDRLARSQRKHYDLLNDILTIRKAIADAKAAMKGG